MPWVKHLRTRKVRGFELQKLGYKINILKINAGYTIINRDIYLFFEENKKLKGFYPLEAENVNDAIRYFKKNIIRM